WGSYDLIFYDQCLPETLPHANTLFLGAVPPLPGWWGGEASPAPAIFDIDRSHPLTQLVEMGNVLLAEARPLKAPPGADVLFESTAGPVFVIAGRDGFEDAVLGFELVGPDARGNPVPKTDWPVRRSFPVFVMNMLRYLGGNRGAIALGSVQPGESVTLRSLLPVNRIEVESPSNLSFQVEREGQNAFVFTKTDELGIYQTHEGTENDVAQRFAVNLFDTRESDLNVPDALEIEYEKIAGQTASEPSRRELWKWLLLVGLGVLLFEWYVYNRRVYF
ncbi:MAG: hypothetical protein AB7O38_03795, partial [Pirellulaceae bacterium]